MREPRDGLHAPLTVRTGCRIALRKASHPDRKGVPYMSRQKKCLLILAGVFAFFIVLGVIGSISSPTPAPSPTPTPEPTATPRPTATPTPVPQGIGPTRREILSVFQEFMSFESSPLNDGTERWMGSDDTSLVEVIGPASRPYKVSMIFSTADAGAAAVNVLLFMAAVDPERADAGLDWVSNNVGSARAGETPTTTIGGVVYSLQEARALVPGGILLSAEGS